MNSHQYYDSRESAEQKMFSLGRTITRARRDGSDLLARICLSVSSTVKGGITTNCQARRSKTGMTFMYEVDASMLKRSVDMLSPTSTITVGLSRRSHAILKLIRMFSLRMFLRSARQSCTGGSRAIDFTLLLNDIRGGNEYRQDLLRPLTLD